MSAGKKPLAYSAKQLAASLNMPKTGPFPLRPDHSAIEQRYKDRISIDLFRWQVNFPNGSLID